MTPKRTKAQFVFQYVKSHISSIYLAHSLHEIVEMFLLLEYQSIVFGIKNGMNRFVNDFSFNDITIGAISYNVRIAGSFAGDKPNGYQG